MNVREDLLKRIKPEKYGQRSDELCWDKEGESFSDFFERLLKIAEDRSDKLVVGEDALADIGEEVRSQLVSVLERMNR